MRVLLWSPPWPVHGDPRFFLNAFSKHLCAQANSLAGFADSVTMVMPAHFAEAAQVLDHRVTVVLLPLALSRIAGPQPELLYQTLYTEPDGPLARQLQAQLDPYLPAQTDVILQWENPVPFLQARYPEALIVNQMPGAFSRPPYPHTVTMDPIGLYQHGTLHRHAVDIQTGGHLRPAELALADDFMARTRTAISCFQAVAEPVMTRAAAFGDTALLPLQSSRHYAFAADAGFSGQLDMLWSVLDGLAQKTGLIVTQYRSGLVSDTPLDKAVAAPFAAQFPNFIYDPQLETLDSVSQYLLPYVDQVISASSSLGLQGMVWQKPLRTLGDTFLAGYDYGNLQLAGVPWACRCANTVATILVRHQPLASAVTQDGAFLFDLLTDMRDRQRRNAEGLDLLPVLTDLAPDYGDRLMAGFRVDTAARSLAMVPVKNAASGQLARLRALIDDPATRAISFDVFDTLICRSVEKPADLFRFLEQQALALTGGIAVDFGRIRSLCETETRQRLRPDKAEITIDDIYDTLALYYGVDADALTPLKAAEIAHEVGHARCRPFGKVMFDLAHASGKPICLISDMYLPAQSVARMLEATGYEGLYVRLFVSSDHGCTKHSGDLFDLVLAEMRLTPADLVHVGDNKHTDVAMAEARGIRAYRWSSAIEWLRTNPVFKDIYAPRNGAGEKARSALAGTTARGLFDAPQPTPHLRSLGGGDPYRLGFAVLGPLLTGYVMWLHREALRDKISDLYFMAREGWILKEIHDRLFPPSAGTPRTHYLLGSRRAVRMAACRSAADVMALLAVPYDPGVRLDALIEGRFGITLTDHHLPQLAEAGALLATMPLDRSFAHRQLLCGVVQALMPDILAQAGAERTSYLAYLDTAGFCTSPNPGVVDIGWKGNIQGALGDLTGRRTTGYYYATVQDSEIWTLQGDRHRAYAGVGVSTPLAQSVAVRNRRMTEFLLCHAARSLVAMTLHNDSPVPVYRPEPAGAKRRALIDPLHAGAIGFAKLFHDGFGDVFDQITIAPDLAEAALGAFLTRPDPADAGLFIGQAFEDALGGIAQKYVIAPAAKAGPQHSVWRAGIGAAHHTARKPVAPKSTSVAAKTYLPRPASLESLAVRGISSGRKLAKYQRDRVAFFEDSQSPLVRLYWKTIAGRP